MTVRIAVVGAGTIGRHHVKQLLACPDTELTALVDPEPAAAELARDLSVGWHPSLEMLLATDRPDGVVLATPNHLHVDGGLKCIAAGVPLLVEKPLARNVEEGQVLVTAAEAAGVPLLVGHHRVHSPLVARAREIVRSGQLGRVVAVVGTALFRKPDAYFEVGDGWRRRPGGGPVLVNLVHEVNSLEFILGDITHVQALASNAVRDHEVEDTAAVLLTFASGAIGTFVVSDASASPWSWEQTSGEDRSYAPYPDQDCYRITGTAGSLAVPTMELFLATGPATWNDPMETSRVDVERTDPLARQISHFAAVVRGETLPLCSGRDGLRTLAVVEAIARSAIAGTRQAIQR